MPAQFWNLDTVKRTGYINPVTRNRLKERESSFDNAAQEAWKENVSERVERASAPIVDTGFQYVEAGEEYPINHPNLSSVPSQVVVLFCEDTDEPREGIDAVHRVNGIHHNGTVYSGMDVYHMSRGLSYLKMGVR